MTIIAAQESLFPDMDNVRERTRDKVSGSNSGHCRMEIWLAANGWPRAPREFASLRTMELGTLSELAMFDRVSIFDPVAGAIDNIGPWWPNMGILEDPVTKEQIDCSKAEVVLRQEELEIDGFKGHQDCIALIPHIRVRTNLPEGEGELCIEPVVLDAKTMPGLTWKRNFDGDLLANVFSREYVFQLQFYLEAWKRKGGVKFKGKNYGVPKRAALVCFNKENSKVMLRFVYPDEGLVSEMNERLSWSRSEAPPKPDWDWQRGKQLPLRCQYCDYRESCAGVRGASIEEAEKGAKGWIATSLGEGKTDGPLPETGHRVAHAKDEVPQKED